MLVGGLVVGLLGDTFLFGLSDQEYVGSSDYIKDSLGSEQTPKTSSEVILIDKIYTFLAPYDSQQCDNEVLEAEYNYWVLVEIVTPHDCQINVTIIDPVQDVYKVFRTDVNVSQGDGWFSFPFGTAIAGNYTFIFSVVAELNLNMLVKVSYDPEHDKSLHDIMTDHDKANLKLYHVTKFYDQTVIEHQIFLRSDYCYKFYIGRVTTIGGESTLIGEVCVDYDIDDPEGIPFKIYGNKTLPGVGSVAFFSFGTAVEGVYTIKILIYCVVEVVNVAYAIIEDYKKSTENECNCTLPDPEDPDPEDPTPNNGTNPQNYFYVPIEWTVGFAATAGLVVGALIVIGISRRKKKSVSLN